MLQYSVMQSDGNSYCGYVVLDSFNMVYTTVMKCILEQKYEKRIFGGIFIIKNWNKSDQRI